MAQGFNNSLELEVHRVLVQAALAMGTVDFKLGVFQAVVVVADLAGLMTIWRSEFLRLSQDSALGVWPAQAGRPLA